MFGTQNLTLFILSGLLLNLFPGQDTFYVIGRSVSQGRRAGMLSVLGISSGGLIHTLMAACGLSAILATSASAFMVLKLAGAAYLIYLGIRMIFERPVANQSTKTPLPGRNWAIFRAGVLTNVLNPKVALFFLAFLPQFVDPACEVKVLAFLFLGLLFLFNSTIWYLFLAWCAAAISQRFRSGSNLGAWLKRAIGALFVGLGVKLGVSS